MLERAIGPNNDEHDLISFAKLRLCELGYSVLSVSNGYFRPRDTDPETGEIRHVYPLARGTAQTSRTRNGAWAMCADDQIRVTTEEPDRELTTRILDLRSARPAEPKEARR